MAGPDRTTTRSATPRRMHRLASLLAPALLVFALGALTPSDARADDHDPQRAGHPIRFLAYLVHPVGVALDWLIVRPAHWVVEREPFRTIFGHEPN